jgi:uncharacterized protein YraI
MRPLRTLAIACLCALPVAALAQTFAVTTTAVNMRAGPDMSYPLVARVPAGTSLSVGGCLNSFTWCDVYAGDLRGWVYASYLTYPYQSSVVPIYSYGPALGLPIIAFSIGTYWDNYYRGRPFYSNRNYWYGRPWQPPPQRFRSDWHAPPPPAYHPPAYHPPPGPPPGHGGYRPPSGGNHPPPSGSNHPPPSAGNHPPPSAGNHPPPSGNRPPPPSAANHSPPRPEARPDGTYRDIKPGRNNASGGEAGG